VEDPFADVTGWDFDWLDGRAVEERPSWGYARLLAARLATVRTALDIDTGGGEVIAGVASLPERMCVTESWPPNVQRARERLGASRRRGPAHARGRLLAVPRRDVRNGHAPASGPPRLEEIHRVLVPGRHYFAQHIGPASAAELIEVFRGPPPDDESRRHPDREVAAAERAGLTVTDLRTATCRMEFFDIGAVVYTLRRCVWCVPDFLRPALPRQAYRARRPHPNHRIVRRLLDPTPHRGPTLEHTPTLRNVGDLLVLTPL
jgi:hypothetical protein